MVKRHLKYFVFIASLLCSIRVTALEITLCENAIPPWVIEEQGQISKRSLIRIFTEQVFHDIKDVHVSYRLLPWRRCQEQVKQGKIDGTLFMYVTEERQKDYRFSDITIEYPEGFLYSKGNFPQGIKIDQYEELVNYRIGLLRGHSYHPELMRLKEQGKLKFELIESSEQSLKMLVAGRIDIMVEGLVNAKYYLSEKQLNDKVGFNQGILEFQADMAYGFYKSSPIIKYLPRINNNIKKLRSEGLHTELLQKDYFIETSSR